MIKFYDQVPTIYSNASRDFQYLSWLINIVLNSVKHNVDDLYTLPNTHADVRLTELLAMTLGFKVKRNYNQEQLLALVSVIPSILKYKGTITAIEMAGNALIKTSGASGSFTSEQKGYLLEITIPSELIDTALFIDLLPYILPAGMSYRVVRKSEKQDELSTDLNYSDRVEAHLYTDLSLASMYSSTTAVEPIFTNYTDNGQLVTGLLDNSVIPILEKSLKEDTAMDSSTGAQEA